MNKEPQKLFTQAEVRKAMKEEQTKRGRKGGRATAKKRGAKHYARIGKMGAEARWKKK